MEVGGNAKEDIKYVLKFIIWSMEIWRQDSYTDLGKRLSDFKGDR